MLSLIAVILFTSVVDYYVDSIASHQLVSATLHLLFSTFIGIQETSTLAQAGIAVGFVVGWLTVWSNDYDGAGILEWFCFALIMAGNISSHRIE